MFLQKLIKICSHFKFWSGMVVGCLAVAVIAIGTRQMLKPYLSPEVRMILKSIHVYAGILLTISACFHGLGRSGYLVRLQRRRQEKLASSEK